MHDYHHKIIHHLDIYDGTMNDHGNMIYNDHNFCLHNVLIGRDHQYHDWETRMVIFYTHYQSRNNFHGEKYDIQFNINCNANYKHHNENMGFRQAKIFQEGWDFLLNKENPKKNTNKGYKEGEGKFSSGISGKANSTIVLQQIL